MRERSCVRCARPSLRRRFLSRPRRLCSRPFWRRRADRFPVGHRSGRRWIPGNTARQPVPIEPFAPNTPETGMVRHYTLSSEDLALIDRRRGDANRLGFALMLCYLRFPGRILGPPERFQRDALVDQRRGDWLAESGFRRGPEPRDNVIVDRDRVIGPPERSQRDALVEQRSEERRVGKEC